MKQWKIKFVSLDGDGCSSIISANDSAEAELKFRRECWDLDQIIEISEYEQK